MDEIGLAVVLLVLLIISVMIWDQRKSFQKELVTQEIDIGDISNKQVSDIHQDKTGTDAEFDKIFNTEHFDDPSGPTRPAMVPEGDLPSLDSKTWYRDMDPARLREKVELSERAHDEKRVVPPLITPPETTYYNPLARVGTTEQFY